MNNLHPLQNLDGCINTASGVKFNLVEPKPGMVCIEDIATGLAFNAHFNGQSPHFFSIAQHSIMVYNLTLNETGNPELAFVALLHDAAEAYTGDIIKPLKIRWPEFEQIEANVLTAIFQKLGLYGNTKAMMRDIKEFDLEIQQQEYEQFYKEVFHFHYLAPNPARELFLQKFKKAKHEFSNYLKKLRKKEVV